MNLCSSELLWLKVYASWEPTPTANNSNYDLLVYKEPVELTVIYEWASWSDFAELDIHQERIINMHHVDKSTDVPQMWKWG